MFLHSQRNDSGNGTYVIRTGMDDIYTLGRIKLWENQEYMDVWADENSFCNRISGTDGLIFPPFTDTNSLIEVFNSDICR